MVWNFMSLARTAFLLAEAGVEKTLAEELAVPIIMLILTSVVTIIGALVSWQVMHFRSTQAEHEERLDLITFYLVKVMNVSGVRGGSDLVRPRSRKGDSSAG